MMLRCNVYGNWVILLKRLFRIVKELKVMEKMTSDLKSAVSEYQKSVHK